MISTAEHLHQVHGEQIEPLSVFYGKPEFEANPDIPWDAELTPFPIGIQENGKPMPQWEDLSQWMKVMMATMVGHQWDLLTFNIHLHPDLEQKLVATQNVRTKLSERARKHLGRAVGKGREFFFVIEGLSTDTLAPTFLHIHGAAALYQAGEGDRIESAIAAAAGHVRGASRQRRAVHSELFTKLQPAYGDYLFKFVKQFDPRLDERRLVMSQSMTQAARDFWVDITRPHLRTDSTPTS
jgi:hypothetical protein